MFVLFNRVLFFALMAILLAHSVFSLEGVESAEWQQADRNAVADQFDAAAEKVNEDGFPSPNGAKRRFLRDFESAKSFLSANTSKKITVLG